VSSGDHLDEPEELPQRPASTRSRQHNKADEGREGKRDRGREREAEEAEHWEDQQPEQHKERSSERVGEGGLTTS
jgi:hypothetical protein